MRATIVPRWDRLRMELIVDTSQMLYCLVNLLHKLSYRTFYIRDRQHIL
jgi:hypothetical protein